MAYNSNNNNKKRNFKKNNNNNQKQPVKKNTYVKIQVPVAYSEFYSSSIDSLYNLLNEITFDKIVISVKAYRNIIFNNPEAEGSMNVGSIVKFNKSKSIDEYYRDIETAFTDSEKSADVCDANDADAVDIE